MEGEKDPDKLGTRRWQKYRTEVETSDRKQKIWQAIEKYGTKHRKVKTENKKLTQTNIYMRYEYYVILTPHQLEYLDIPH